MSVMRFTPSVESKPIREIAYETLKHAIITGQIPAGARIVETEYADKLHISRTPLREALRKLERDGLVEYVLRRGVVVRAFTIADVEEIYTIRNALEMLTLPAIIDNATPEDIRSLRDKLHRMDAFINQNDIEGVSPLARSFHDELTAISGLNRILRVIQGQDEYIRRFSAMSIAKETRRKVAHEEHYKLLEYLEQRDLASFERLMRKHIERSKETCLMALSEANYQPTRA
ncbi:MAG: GntR family transcriptional regulator [Candidatus Limiplasma sp.]|nr:GntR family transcriptional regulator [Candidatus Limiplasma sp.]